VRISWQARAGREYVQIFRQAIEKDKMN
jgi:hypothetical protein